VPTGQVPAAKINGQLYWESATILDQLEKEFPTPSLSSFSADEAEKERAERFRRLCEDPEDPQNTFGAVGYGLMRANTTTEPAARQRFEAALERIENALGETKGPFFLSEFSTIDILFTPQLERFAANLPTFKNFHIKNNLDYPRINAWFKAMDAKESYRKVKSDPETLNNLMRKIFGVSGGASAEVGGAAAREAAAKLVANREAVRDDILKNAGVDPSSGPAVEAHLRRVASVLLTGDPGPPSTVARDAAAGAAALAFVRNRVSSPRDMSADAADAFREAVDSVLKHVFDGGRAIAAS